MARKRSTPWNIGCRPWLKKYFWEGQMLSDEIDLTTDNVYSSWRNKFLQKHRRLLSLVIPALVIHFCWWTIAVRYNLFHLFLDKYKMSITMVFGSIIAGMTSEGGGAVAFPVMTLLMNIKPTDAKDFSLLIQSVGMTGAMFSIIYMGVQIEWNAIILGTLGGGIGLILGLQFIDQLIPASWKKMCFVSIWFSFAFALFLLNRQRKRLTHREIPHMCLWKSLILVLSGAVGGIFTSFAGSGIDICMFSITTLLFRVSEKTATPTSVVLMAINTTIGAFWRAVIMRQVTMETFEYLFVCVPIVVVGAPLGSVLGSHFHRQVLAGLIYILDTAALISAFALVKQTAILAGVSVGIIVFGFIFFFILTKVGQWILERELILNGKTLAQNGNNTESVVKEPVNGEVNLAYISTDSGGDSITVSRI